VSKYLAISQNQFLEILRVSCSCSDVSDAYDSQNHQTTVMLPAILNSILLCCRHVSVTSLQKLEIG